MKLGTSELSIWTMSISTRNISSSSIRALLNVRRSKIGSDGRGADCVLESAFAFRESGQSLFASEGCCVSSLSSTSHCTSQDHSSLFSSCARRIVKSWIKPKKTSWGTSRR